jgi:hypothetical protein
MDKPKRSKDNVLIILLIRVEDLQLEIDGKSIHNLEQYRLAPPSGGFELEIVENNIRGDPAGNRRNL